MRWTAIFVFFFAVLGSSPSSVAKDKSPQKDGGRTSTAPVKFLLDEEGESSGHGKEVTRSTSPSPGSSQQKPASSNVSQMPTSSSDVQSRKEAAYSACQSKWIGKCNDGFEKTTISCRRISLLSNAQTMTLDQCVDAAADFREKCLSKSEQLCQMELK